MLSVVAWPFSRKPRIKAERQVCLGCSLLAHFHDYLDGSSCNISFSLHNPNVLDTNHLLTTCYQWLPGRFLASRESRLNGRFVWAAHCGGTLTIISTVRLATYPFLCIIRMSWTRITYNMLSVVAWPFSRKPR